MDIEKVAFGCNPNHSNLLLVINDNMRRRKKKKARTIWRWETQTEKKRLGRESPSFALRLRGGWRVLSSMGRGLFRSGGF